MLKTSVIVHPDSLAARDKGFELALRAQGTIDADGSIRLAESAYEDACLRFPTHTDLPSGRRNLAKSEIARIKKESLDRFHAAWREIHRLADADALTAENLLAIVATLQLCTCKLHAKSYVDQNPIPATDQRTWAIDFHNAVNERLGKPLWFPDS